MKGKLVKCLTTATMITLLATGFSINSEAASTPKLNKTKITLTEGKSYTLKVKNTKAKIKWSSSKKSVATVSSKGRVVAKKKGTAIIKATFKYKKNGKKVNKTLKCKVTVKAKQVKKATATPKPTVRPTAVPTATPKPTATVTPTATAVPTESPVVVEPTTVPTEAPVEVVSPETPVHVHNYNAKYEVVKESTCTEDGLIRMYCECGEVYERVICATHHNKTYSKTDSLVPTEETDGYFGYHCNDCGQDVTFSERTTFPALTDENYPLDGWVYEKHDYDYNSLYYMSTGEVDFTHEKPYIVVSDYIGTAEHPALKDKYVIDGVEYDVEMQGKLNITSPTVQSLRIVGGTWVNPDRSVLIEKKIISYELGGLALYD